MEVLVLGAGGMAGHMIAIYLQEAGYRVTGFARSPLSFCETIVGDATSQERIWSAVTRKPFDAVINCIGVLNKAVDQNVADGIYLNSYLPHYLVNCLKGTAARVIHLSTDCVFSGRQGNYREDSFKDGETLYDITKSLGEIDDGRNLTFRASIIGPDMRKKGMGLLNWFLQQKETVNGFTGAIWTGVSTYTLAQAIDHALKEKLTGLYHLVNNTRISKYDLLQLINRMIREEAITIIPSDAVQVDKSLVNNRTDFRLQVPTYEQMMMDTKEWMRAHRELYPHYH
ncbi:sugar nucleotide-binding protein [Cohnella lupini]|uniref:dTDP-4-dehydrorhamnose reductase n=1 Tax=Cohnella lupini TaxID=1294267 RepID=A0A3D9I743_9BACL|nr:sugar nucleotide-binding protein [Cohnella lupini]RED57588.1 dTDP-4-dehydrorhamnose reductase [Cohnella lupini]